MTSSNTIKIEVAPGGAPWDWHSRSQLSSRGLGQLLPTEQIASWIMSTTTLGSVTLGV
jgi:hypothetical protein